MGMTTRSPFSTIATASSAEASPRLYSPRQSISVSSDELRLLLPTPSPVTSRSLLCRPSGDDSVGVECRERTSAPRKVMSSKLERDIEEILAQVDKFPKPPAARRFRPRLSNAAGAFVATVAGLPRPRVSVGQVLLLGIALVVIAYVFGDSFGTQSVVRL